MRRLTPSLSVPGGDSVVSKVATLNITAPPRLSVTRVAGHIVLSWPTSPGGFSLQSLAAFAAGTRWEDATAPATLSNGQNVVTLPTTEAVQLFRLKYELDAIWKDALGGVFKCTVAGTPGTWKQMLPAAMTADPSAGTIPNGGHLRRPWRRAGESWLRRVTDDAVIRAGRFHLEHPNPFGHAPTMRKGEFSRSSMKTHEKGSRPLSVNKQPSNSGDLRSRVLGIHGKPLPQATALLGQKSLERDLARQFEQQKAQQGQANKDYRKILGPIIQLVGQDKSAVSAFRARQRRIAQNRQVKLFLPELPEVETQIKSGSITTVVAPPYNYGWLTGGPGLTVDEGAVFGDFSKEKGRLSAGFKLSNGATSISVGLGAYFRPLSILCYVRFTAFVTYNYSWFDSADFLTAHNHATIGFYISSVNLRGQDPRVDFDGRTPLWSDGVSWLEEHSDSNSALLRNPQNEAILVASSERHYFVWVWVSTWGDATTSDTFFGRFVSRSNSDLLVYIPFMVFQQL